MVTTWLDLYEVTENLIKLLDDRKGNPPLFSVTGQPPDEIRDLSGCQLSLYLFHVSQDKFQRNSPVTGPWTSNPQDKSKTTTRFPINRSQPLSLELYYLLTAYSKEPGGLRQEQQAISIAMQCFHEQPIVKVLATGQHFKEICLTMEIETADELGRLWQATTSALRLGVVYKVSVVFLQPPETPQLSPLVQTLNLAVSPASLPFAKTGQVISAYNKIHYIGPNDTPLNPDRHSYDQVPAIVASGQEFFLYGAGFDQPSAANVYLLFPDGTIEQQVTPWIVPDQNPKDASATIRLEGRITLKLPETMGMPPAGTPPPGVYQLRVGGEPPMTIRSNATPLSIAAWIDPSGAPCLSPDGSGVYVLNGRGFSPGTLEVLLETLPLEKSATVGAGQFNVNADGTVITFRLPDNLPIGQYGVRVRVNQVESLPAKWVVKT